MEVVSPNPGDISPTAACLGSLAVVFAVRLLLTYFYARDTAGKGTPSAPDHLIGDSLAKAHREARASLPQALAETLAYFDRPSGLDTANPREWTRVSSSSSPIQSWHSCCGRVHSIKMECDFDVSAEALVATAREIDLIPAWNKYVSFGRILKEYSRDEVQAAVRFWVPPPFGGVRCVIDACLDDLIDSHGGYLISAVPADVEQGNLPEELHNLADVPMHNVSLILPVTATASRTRLIAHLPASMVPSWVIKLVLHVIGPWVYRASCVMFSSALRPGEPLHDRIVNGPNKELYADISARCTAHLRAKAPGVD